MSDVSCIGTDKLGSESDAYLILVVSDEFNPVFQQRLKYTHSSVTEPVICFSSTLLKIICSRSTDGLISTVFNTNFEAAKKSCDDN